MGKVQKYLTSGPPSRCPRSLDRPSSTKPLHILLNTLSTGSLRAYCLLLILYCVFVCFSCVCRLLFVSMFVRWPAGRDLLTFWLAAYHGVCVCVCVLKFTQFPSSTRQTPWTRENRNVVFCLAAINEQSFDGIVTDRRQHNDARTRCTQKTHTTNSMEIKKQNTNARAHGRETRANINQP